MSLNVGILGHVDCGKTTLTRILAEVASTAAFDKHALRGGRQNTLDLGFSSLFVNERRLALIDCPGHSSLIKAVLAASSVLDMAIIVIDASNGIQPQTAEHLLLCSIFCRDHILIVLNKIDLVAEEEIQPIINRIRKNIKLLGMNSQCIFVPITLQCPTAESLNILMTAIKETLYDPQRESTGNFVMAVDHCFTIKGKGTVLTGTVIDGSISLNQEIELPLLKEKRKVKGLESWKTQVEKASIGERAAVLVQNVDSERFSRTMICGPGILTEIQCCLCKVNPIPFYRSQVASGSKFHVSAGFETVMAECSFVKPTSISEEYENIPYMESDCSVILQFDQPIYARLGTFYIASKLEHQGKGCRFAFYGKLDNIRDISTIKRFVRKTKQGKVERIENNQSLICHSLFKKETKFSLFEGMSVILSTGEQGQIDSSFGKSGKTRISFKKPLAESTIEALNNARNSVDVTLYLKKYMNDKSLQSYIP